MHAHYNMMTVVGFSGRHLLFFIVAACVSACVLPSSVAAQTVLNPAQVQKVGMRIWQNECDGTVAGLTSWNAGEEFASLGIGHFIWYPKGYSGPFEESFPPLVAWLRQRGAQVPEWLLKTSDCPWNSRETFLKDSAGPRQQSLRTLLRATVREQTEFIMARLNAAVPRLIQAGGKRVQTSYAALSRSPEGMFAMLDYINFKGDGINSKERYNGQGWGLAQVLGDMRDGSTAEFAEAAKRVLARRVKNAPPERRESRWLEGWSNRCNGYKRKL